MNSGQVVVECWKWQDKRWRALLNVVRSVSNRFANKIGESLITREKRMEPERGDHGRGGDFRVNRLPPSPHEMYGLSRARHTSGRVQSARRYWRANPKPLKCSFANFTFTEQGNGFWSSLKMHFENRCQ